MEARKKGRKGGKEGGREKILSTKSNFGKFPEVYLHWGVGS